MINLPDNMTYLGSSRYVVRTQAGFVRALKHYDPERAKEKNRGVQNYPKQYPALVILNEGYFGYHFTNVRVLYLEDLEYVVTLLKPAVRS